jgi:hypothetical protein
MGINVSNIKGGPRGSVVNDIGTQGEGDDDYIDAAYTATPYSCSTTTTKGGELAILSSPHTV